MAPRKALGRWRWRLKEGLASVITSVQARRRPSVRPGAGYRPLVLGYHRVVEDFASESRTEMASMLTSTAMFEQHLDWIGRHFRFVDVDEIGAAVRNGVPFEQPVAAVTFDDGYRDVYEQAIPVLKRKGIPAAVFVVTDLVGRSRWQQHDKLYHLVEKGFQKWDSPRRQLHGLLTDLGLPADHILRKRNATKTPLLAVSALLPNLSRADVGRVMQYLEWGVGNGFVNVPQTLTWPMLARMRRDGFTIGSHTRSHVSLPMESAASTIDELEGSKATLEEHLSEPIEHFAYPGGQFTPAVVEALEHSGYRYAYTACPHQDPRHPALTIERLLLWEGSSTDADGRFSPAILGCQVRDLWPPARRCARAHA
jgi:peptidoglycan/xylan/chitin deacetylase (PgdA/CDA1 family)